MLKNLRPGNGAEVFCFLGSLANLQDSSLQEPESHSWLLKEAENHHEAQKGHEERESASASEKSASSFTKQLKKSEVLMNFQILHLHALQSLRGDPKRGL